MAIRKINSRSIGDTAVATADIADGSITTAKIADTVNLGRRNLIINGAMQVAQRGTSVSGTIGFYGLDRWRGYAAASVTMSQQSFSLGQTDVEGFPKNYMRFVPSTAAYNFGQRIEDLTTVGGKTLTLSFWIKGSTAATFDCSYTRYFGSGGSSADTTEFLSDQAITTSWSKVTKTFTVGSLSGKTVGSGSYLQITFGDSISFTSSQTVEIANVQLEVGDTATLFEHRSYGEELTLCQRYYQKHGNETSAYRYLASAYCNQTTQAQGVLTLPVTMRTAPTTSVSGNFQILTGSANAAITLSTKQVNESSIGLEPSGSGFVANSGAIIRGANDATAQLKLDAEL